MLTVTIFGDVDNVKTVLHPARQGVLNGLGCG